MAALVYARKATTPVVAEHTLRSDFKIYENQPTRLSERVLAQTQPGRFTMVLAGLCVLLYLFAKFLVWQRYGALYFGWFDVALAVLATLAALFFLLQARHRSVPSRGTPHPASLFLREDRRVIALSLDQGEHRAKSTFAGPVPAGYGVTVGRMVYVDYVVDGQRYQGQGSLFPGDTPAMIRVDQTPSFAVVCDGDRPTRAVLVTEYDYEAAPGEAS